VSNAEKQGIVVVSPAAVGKTYLGQKYPKEVLDLGVMNFSTLVKNPESRISESKKNLLHTNPEWPHNYFKAIKEKREEYDIVCVAFLIELLTDAEFAKELRKNKIEYVIVLPKASDIPEIIQRMKDRGNSTEFIDVIEKAYPKIIREFSKPKYNSVFIGTGEYLEHALIRARLLIPNKDQTSIQKAIDFATERHKTQTLNNRPYIAHPLLVYEIVKEIKPNDEELQIAALLHDVVEDTAPTLVGKAMLLAKIETEFGKKVGELVAELTDNAVERKQIGKVAYDSQSCLRMSADALTVRLADRLSHTYNIFGMSFEDTFNNAMVTRQVVDNLVTDRDLDEIQKQLVDRFNEAFDKFPR